MRVVVPFGVGEDLPGVGLVHEQDVVEGLAADGADHPLAVGVHPWRPWRAEQHVHVLGFEDGVEGRVVLGVAVAQHEAQGLHARVELGGEIAGCCVAQARVGWVVTPVMWSLRVPCSRNATA
jgi:hypothetical protein